MGFGTFHTIATVVVLAASTVSIVAASDTRDRDPDPRNTAKRITALRSDGRSPEVDGRLDDAVWSRVEWVSDFVQKEPNQGEDPTLRTEVAFVYDDHALYIGARMYSDDPSQIETVMTRRDDEGNGEVLVVSLDTYLDRRTAYSFAVTAAGVRVDWFHPRDHEFWRDKTFDPVWMARTEVNANGWTAEMRIPFSQLRFSGTDELVWGVNLKRVIPSRNEDDYWVLVPRDETGWASRFGELVGIRDLPGSKRIEVTPYFASSARLISDELFDPDDPFEDATDLDVRGGVDFKMGLGPNLTLDATFNPDFGQVEADPAEVNLSAFETFFEERRLFFTEGRQNFEGEGPSYYYSRRIGAPPHGDADSDFVDAPQVTTIVTAAKLTGRLDSGLSIGALAAVSDEERARTFDLETNTKGEAQVEPLATYGVVRLQQEFGPNASTFGGTMTYVQRSVSGGPLEDTLVERAVAGGVDWNKRFNGGAYDLQGHIGFSHVSGSEAAIAEIQERSAHYFQRPDAGHVDFDPTRTSLTGWSAGLYGGKRSGNWKWNHGVAADSPGFEINDAGRLGRADDLSAWGNLSYRQTEPGDVLRNWQLGVWTSPAWNFDGINRRKNVGMWGNATWNNFWRVFLDVGHDFTTQSDNQTRGGPLMTNPSETWGALTLHSNSASATRWEVRGSAGTDELGGWAYSLRTSFFTQPNDRLTLSVAPRYRRSTDARQYIDTQEGGPEATFGSRYIFGRVARSEIAASVRVNYSFSPDLNVELYAEPFASSGSYSRIGELARARSFDLREYGVEEGTGLERDEEGNFTFTDGDASFEVDNPDFDVLSFRSNLVLRWEWRPGSTLFLVWQQNRSADDDRGEFVSPGDLFDTLTTDGENLLAIKFSYWLPL